MSRPYPHVKRLKVPLDVLVERGRVDAFGDVDAVCQVTDVLQGPLDACRHSRGQAQIRGLASCSYCAIMLDKYLFK